MNRPNKTAIAALPKPTTRKPATRAEQTVKVTFNPLALVKQEKFASYELAQLEGSTVENDEDAAQANTYLKDRVRELKALDELLAETVEPFKEGVKRVKALFSPARESLVALVETVKGMLKDYSRTQAVEQQRLLEEARETATQASPEALADTLNAVADAAPAKLEGTSFRQIWTWRVVNSGLIPPEWYCLDTKALDDKCRAHKAPEDLPVVPGVVFELGEPVATVRT